MIILAVHQLKAGYNVLYITLEMSEEKNSYLYVKSIAEELRGLAVEANIPIVTATQTNR